MWMLWFPIYAAPALGPTVFIVRYCYAYIVSFFFDQLCRKMWDDLIGWQETNESQAKPHGKRNGWTIHVHTAKGAMPFIRRVWEQTAFLGKILCFFSPDTYINNKQWKSFLLVQIGVFLLLKCGHCAGSDKRIFWSPPNQETPCFPNISTTKLFYS